MKSIKRSITLPQELDRYVQNKARETAKTRGGMKPNFSAALTDMIIEAKNPKSKAA